MDGNAGKSDATGGRRGRALKQRLESLASAGVTSLPKRRGPKPRPAIGSRSAERTLAPAAAAAQPPAAGAVGRIRSLDVLRDEVAACRLCKPLAKARTHTVFGVGSATARLCFLGEAPGADEDASGEPFVGRAGQLLTKIIEACTLSRDEVYILNVLKCRPPDNRRPQPDETANCRGYFEKQLEIIAPEFICCLGTTAAQALLQTDETIGNLRKRWFTWRTSQVICTYHPSYLLRNPPAKRDVWDDMKLLMAKMGVQL
jgi:uracil-DNA glycosylase family 4